MADRTCSVDGCSTVALAKGLCRKHYAREWAARPKVEPDQFCARCGAPINRGVRRGPKARFCSAQCRYDEDLELRRASSKERRALDPKSCLHCGVVFTPEHSRGQKYCTRMCKNAASLKRRAEAGDVCSEDDCFEGTHAKGLCNKHYVRSRYWESKALEGPILATCEECGADFEAATKGKRFCSGRCARRARYERVKSGHYGVCSVDGCLRGRWAKGLCVLHYRREHFPEVERCDRFSQAQRDAIYSRDGFVCYLCGCTVQTGGDYNADDAATLDHVIPRSKGGSDEDENLRTCCRLCNSLKADSVLDDMELVS